MRAKKRDIVPLLELYEKLDKDIESYKVLYISGHIGLGKTTSILEWLNRKGQRYRYVSVKDETFNIKIDDMKLGQSEIVVIDDLQGLNNENVNYKKIEDKIVTLIKKTENKYVLISRNRPQPWLTYFMLSGDMMLYEERDLIFKAHHIEIFMKNRGIVLEEKDIQTIFEESYGWPLCIAALAVYLKQGEKVSDKMFKKVYSQVFEYFKFLLTNKLNSNLQSFLRYMASFSRFKKEMAIVVAHDVNVEEALNDSLSIGRFITYEPDGYYYFHPIFHRYLKYKQEAEETSDFVEKVRNNAGSYYDGCGDMINALKYYTMAKNETRVRDILIENSRRNYSTTHYYEIEKHYLSLSEDTIKESIELMSGMAMLHSVCYRIKESEYWFNKIKELSETVPNTNPKYRKAKEELIYLSIELPHRNILVENINDRLGEYNRNKAKFRPISFTGNLPSFFKGGKEFEIFRGKDKDVYSVIKDSFEKIWNNEYCGVSELIQGESTYEKSCTEDFVESLILINTGLSKFKNKDYLEIYFAAYGTISRIFIAQGDMKAAQKIMNDIHEEAKEKQQIFLLPNIEAVQTKLYLLIGETKKAKELICKNQADENRNFQVLHCYIYMMKIRMYIQIKNYTAAISLAVHVREVYKDYNRPYGVMECNLLYAITLYKMGSSKYEEPLKDAIEFSRGYGFIRTIADEGKPVYEMIQNSSINKDDSFIRKIIRESKKQAVLYPHYLEVEERIVSPLTDTEKKVLDLMKKGLNNSEIAKTLFISISTVKFHASNIYGKLGVKNRMAAISQINSGNII